KQRKEERARLPGAGAGLHDQVFALQYIRDDLLLDRHEPVPAGGAEGGLHGHGKVLRLDRRTALLVLVLDRLEVSLLSPLTLSATGQVDDRRIRSFGLLFRHIPTPIEKVPLCTIGNSGRS